MYCKIYIMLRLLLLRRIYGISGKKPIKELDKLSKKISAQQSQKVQYLEGLISEDKLNEYFHDKMVREFELGDAYFYLLHQDMFTRPGRQVKNQLVMHPKFDTYTKFLMGNLLSALYMGSLQHYLISNFNENCLGLSNYELMYCLKSIVGFKKPQVKINFSHLIWRIQQLQSDQHVYEILYYLSLLKNEQLHLHGKKLASEVCQNVELYKKNLSFPNIYYTYMFAKSFNITPLAHISLLQSQYTFSHSFSFSKQQSQYFVKLLPSYPNYTYYINPNKLNKKSYLAYIQYLLKRKNSFNVVVEHELSYGLINSFSNLQFFRLLHSWVKLKMHTERTIVEKMKFFFTFNLACIHAVLRFCEQKRNDEELWKMIEENLIRGLRIYDKEMEASKITKRYSLEGVLRLFGWMSIKRLGSSKIWSFIMNFISKVFTEPQLIYEMPPDVQNRFFISMFQLFKAKPFNEEMEKQLIQFTIIALSKNDWSIHNLYFLARNLLLHRIGGNKLWYALENKFKTNLSHPHSYAHQQKLLKIIRCFKMMNKGSKPFWKLTKQLHYFSEKHIQKNRAQRHQK